MQSCPVRPSRPEVPVCLRGGVPVHLYSSLVLFPFCSQTFPKGLFPQAQLPHCILSRRLRLHT